jgi:hypothetical protein
VTFQSSSALPSNRGIIISFGALLILAAAFLVYSYVGDDREQAQIRARYTQMSLALSTGDTNAARALIAPQFRPRNRHLEMLRGFAKPLSPKSSIRVSGLTGFVCPQPIYYYKICQGVRD